MKKLILFALTAMFLMSCGGEGLLPTDNITWGTALGYCMTTASYWIFLVLGVVAFVAALYLSIKKYRNADWDGMKATLVTAGGFVIFCCCFFIRPSEIAANTTVEQFARGVVIGY